MYETFTLFGLTSQTVPLPYGSHVVVLNPGMHALRFGLFQFRSPLLSESMFLSLPPAT